MSMGSLMVSKQGIGSEQHENQIGAQMDMSENNPAVIHNHSENLYMTSNWKKMEYALEEQSDMSIIKEIHQISSNTEEVEEMHDNQIMLRDETSMGEISSLNSTMDFDWNSIKSGSTLISMSCMDDNGFAESTIPMTHCATNMPGAIGITFKISRKISVGHH